MDASDSEAKDFRKVPDSGRVQEDFSDDYPAKEQKSGWVSKFTFTAFDDFIEIDLFSFFLVWWQEHKISFKLR